jgi:hypothetical protein
MEINFRSENPIIFQFPRYAGGKFISNCLALSRHCVPQDKKLTDYLIKNPTDYNYRLDAVLKTLPPDNDVLNWINKYELGDGQLFGKAHISWRHGMRDNSNINSTTKKLSNTDLKFFIVCHSGPEEVQNLLQVWPNARIILLINHEKFSGLSCLLKSNNVIIEQFAGNYCRSKYQLLMGSGWPDWSEFESTGFNVDRLTGYSEQILSDMGKFYKWNLIETLPILIDIDSCIFNRDRFLNVIQDLYLKLGFGDFNQLMIDKFWQSYIKLHIKNREMCYNIL